MIASQIKRRFRRMETLVLVEAGAAWAAPGDQRSAVRTFVDDSSPEPSRDDLIRWFREHGFDSITPNEVYFFAHLCRYIVRVPARGQVTTGSIEERGH